MSIDQLYVQDDEAKLRQHEDVKRVATALVSRCIMFGETPEQAKESLRLQEATDNGAKALAS